MRCRARRIGQIRAQSRWGNLIADEMPDADLIEVVCYEGGPRLSDVDEIRIDGMIFDSMLAGAYDALVAPDGESQVELAVQLAIELASEDEAGIINLRTVGERNGN